MGLIIWAGSVFIIKFFALHFLIVLKKKKISVIIPAFRRSRVDNVETLRRSLLGGSLPPDEIIVVEGVSPAAAARNLGVERSKGDILVFIDDDARLSTPDVLERVVETLLSDDSIGIAGASQDIPPSASGFQKEYRHEFERARSQVVEEITESDMATTLFCAIRREDFTAAGGFDESLPAGEDNYLRHRIRGLGKKVVLAPGALVYHPLPGSWGELYRRARWYGSARAILAKREDAPFAGIRLQSKTAALGYLIVQWALFPFRLFIGGPTGRKFGFWPLRAVAHLVNSTAYAAAVIRGDGR